MSVRDLLAAAALPEKTVSLCLRGDLVAEFETLDRQLKEDNDRNSDSFGGGEARDIAERMEKLRDEMKASTAVFALRSLAKMRPLTLIAEHPPRPDNDTDKALGYNQSTYYEALVKETTYEIRNSGDTLAVAEMTEDDWEKLFDTLSYKQFDNLVAAAFQLNNSEVNVPTSALGSLIYRGRDESLKPPSNGESPQNGSPGGNRRGKRNTSTRRAEPLTEPLPA